MFLGPHLFADKICVFCSMGVTSLYSLVPSNSAVADKSYRMVARISLGHPFTNLLNITKYFFLSCILLCSFLHKDGISVQVSSKPLF